VDGHAAQELAHRTRRWLTWPQPVPVESAELRRLPSYSAAPGPLPMRLDESVTRQQIKPGTVRRILPYARRYWWALVALLVMTAADAIITVTNSPRLTLRCSSTTWQQLNTRQRRRPLTYGRYGGSVGIISIASYGLWRTPCNLKYVNIFEFYCLHCVPVYAPPRCPLTQAPVRDVSCVRGPGYA
jgi:hypothetical protein